jgi:phosphoribosylaminoimidazolecarboxamide formyltransferase/IMP cyclohydrolase
MKNTKPIKIKRCLISLSDKTNLVEIAKFLESREVEIISTGGTYQKLLDANIKVKSIEQFTGFPEILDGRVKTLHPKVHGALLEISDNEIHKVQKLANNIESIDLLIVNLYPFVETVATTSDPDAIIENIDIGGPAMIRSTAKNFNYKLVITSPDCYQLLQSKMTEGNNSVDLDFRREMAAKAFENIANYDIAIANWFTKFAKNNAKSFAESVPSNNSCKFASNLKLDLNLKQQLRYGENSHQQAAIYQYPNNNLGIVNAKQLHGKELSYNNFADADSAFNLVLELSAQEQFADKKFSCAIIKHNNPCGVAIANNPTTAYQKAFNADSKSAFGGIVAINSLVDATLATEIIKTFYEVIIAKDFTEDALKIFFNKKNLRLLQTDFLPTDDLDIKSISGGLLIQDRNMLRINNEDLKLASLYPLDSAYLDQLIFALQVVKHIKSNAIAVVADYQTIGLGVGQTNRVDSCKIACDKANEFSQLHSISAKKILASDAFLPFADNVDIAASNNIDCIVATSGSVRDPEVIERANHYKLPLYFIPSRHFKH